MRTLSVVLAFLLPIAVSAQENVFTPQHVAKLRIVTEAVIAPDGNSVAYVLMVPRDIPKEKDGGAWTELHVVDKNGTSTPFITGPVNVQEIAPLLLAAGVWILAWWPLARTRSVSSAQPSVEQKVSA